MNVTSSQLRSKSLFGSLHVLDVCACIAGGPMRFTAPTLEEQTGLPPSIIHGVIGKLRRVDLVHPAGTVNDTRVIEYERGTHPFWDAAVRLRQTAQSPSQGTQESIWSEEAS